MQQTSPNKTQALSRSHFIQGHQIPAPKLRTIVKINKNKNNSSADNLGFNSKYDRAERSRDVTPIQVYSLNNIGGE